MQQAPLLLQLPQTHADWASAAQSSTRGGGTSGGAAAAASSLPRGTAAGWLAAWLGLLAADAPLLGGAAGMRPAALSAEASPRTDLLRRTVPGRLRPWRSLRGGRPVEDEAPFWGWGWKGV